MFIKTQDGQTIVNTDKVSQIAFSDPEGRTIMAFMTDDYNNVTLGTYKDPMDADSAFTSLCITMAEGCGYYAFPKDLRPAKQEGNGENA